MTKKLAVTPNTKFIDPQNGLFTADGYRLIQGINDTVASINDTYVLLDATQTVSNKTLVATDIGTPLAGVMTNVTGTAAGLTAGIANALANSTGSVDVLASSAPNVGQALVAVDSSHATWQDQALAPSNGANVTYDAVNSYLFAVSAAGTTAPGATSAGSNLTPAGIQTTGVPETSGGVRSGTWQAMGSIGFVGEATLWARTA